MTAVLSHDSPAARAIEHSLAQLGDAVAARAPDAVARIGELHRHVARMVAAMKSRILGSPFDCTPADRADCAWMSQVSHALADAATGLCNSLAAAGDGEDLLHALSLALHYQGEALKADLGAGRMGAVRHDTLNGLARLAVDHGLHGRSLRIELDGRKRACTPGALFFRALALARFGSGCLTPRQIEIMDAWMWMRLHLLEATLEPPPSPALRADLDTGHGLKRGPRRDAGPTLYMADDIIEDAYDAAVEALHDGRIVPENHLVASFRIEEHLVVLALMRRGLRSSRDQLVRRPERRAVARDAEMFVGLAEIMTRGLAPAAPRAPNVALATRDGAAAAPRRHAGEFDSAPARAYEPRRRMVRIVDESATGIGLEGGDADCGRVAVGDVVALRPAQDSPLELFRAVRSIGVREGRVRIGLQRLSPRSQHVRAATNGAATSPLLLLLGEDSRGRQDGFLLPESAYRRGAPMEVVLDERAFELKLNRVRQRGRGWVLAGFEVA